MDARLDVEETLGLRTGDAHIIRNAGGLATDDAIRSLIVSQERLGTDEVLVIGHTGCGLEGADEAAMRSSLRTGPGERSTSTSARSRVEARSAPRSSGSGASVDPQVPDPRPDLHGRDGAADRGLVARPTIRGTVPDRGEPAQRLSSGEQNGGGQRGARDRDDWTRPAAADGHHR